MAPEPSNLDDPFDTSDELMAEAAAMEARAARRREASVGEAHRQVTPAAIEHTGEARAVKLAEQEATLARAEAKEFRSKVATLTDQHSGLLKKADELDAAGDTAGANELREDAAGTIEVAQRQLAQAEAAEAAAAAADEQARVHVARGQTLEGTVIEHLERSGAEEKAADEMELSAGVMRNAGGQMTEAERLEAAAIDLRSRGVEGVERIDAAAKTARDEAEVLTLRARQQDPSHSFGTTDDFGVDPNLIEIEPNTPDAPAATDEPTDPETTTPADDNGVDPNLIEIEPNTPDTPATPDDNGVDPNLIEIEPNTPESPAASDDLGIDQDLIEIEPNAADVGDGGFTDEAAETGDGFSGDGFAEQGFAEQGFAEQGFAEQGFAEQGFAEPAAATEDFGNEGFDVDSGDGASDFADSDATGDEFGGDGGDGFGSDGGEGFEGDFEA